MVKYEKKKKAYNYFVTFELCIQFDQVFSWADLFPYIDISKYSMSIRK